MAVFGNCSNLAFIGMRDAVGDENFWNFRKVSPRLVNMHFRSAAVRLFIKR